MNYSAKQITHVYKEVKREKSDRLSKLKHVTPKEAYGNLYLNVEDVFQSSGDPVLKFEYVGYGGVNFLGNIDGKVPTQGLHYKNEDVKREVETLIKVLDIISEDKSEAVNYIRQQHGEPSPQYAVLWQKA